MSRKRGITCVAALTFASSVSCTAFCHYGASGALILPPGASASILPPLPEVVDLALKPLGFSEGTKIHIPGDSPDRSNAEPDHDYVDFKAGVPAKNWSLALPQNPVLVRVEAVRGMIYISDLRRDATQNESPFMRTVRESIQREIQSTYGVTMDIQKVKVRPIDCALADWP